MRLIRMVLIVTLPLQVASAMAQDAPAGQVARSSIGQVGQRQSREQIEPGAGPMERIDTRIQNRVQSRIRNRVDRSYDPRANAVSPFEVASDTARVAGKTTRH